MLSHAGVWAAIDALAAQYSLSASGLAKRAGLDSTAFNKSKRFSADGRPRWPSTESLAKIMTATGATLEEFSELIGTPRSYRYRSAPSVAEVPLIGFAQAGGGGFFDDAGFPVGQGWDSVSVPGKVGEAAYALQVQGDSMLPLYKDGDILIVDPEISTHRGDRVVVKTTAGEVMTKMLARRTATHIELHSLNPEHPLRRYKLAEVSWIARVIWASQ